MVDVKLTISAHLQAAVRDATVRLGFRDIRDLSEVCLVHVRVPTSTVLRNLLQHAPTEVITLAWLMSQLGERSFGFVLLLLGLLAMLPGASVVVGILITVPAFQMILGCVDGIPDMHF